MVLRGIKGFGGFLVNIEVCFMFPQTKEFGGLFLGGLTFTQK